jgi:hypothetical protein
MIDVTAASWMFENSLTERGKQMDSQLIGIILVMGMVCWAAYQIW